MFCSCKKKKIVVCLVILAVKDDMSKKYFTCLTKKVYVRLLTWFAMIKKQCAQMHVLKRVLKDKCATIGS